MSEIIISNKNQISKKYHSGEHERYEYHKQEVTDARQKYQVRSPAEGNQTVVAFYTLPPGKSSYPYHYHTTNEEVFYIISGEGILETSDGERTISAGDIIVCPVGERGAHRLTNSSETEDLVYLDVDTNNTPDIAYYPHSGKLGIRAAGGVHDNYRIGGDVDYYHDEL